MPLKWRIYYACCWCYLVCMILGVAAGVYMMVSDTDQSYSGYWVLIFPLVMVCKPIFGFKFISHLKNQSYYTKNQFIVYSLYFLANIVFSIYIAIAFSLAIVQQQQRGWDSVATTVFIIVTFFYLFAAGYFIKFDMLLKKEIRKQRFTQINFIGNNLE